MVVRYESFAVRLVCAALLVLTFLCAPARAQTASPIVPDVPDEPLPEWKPPTHRVAALHLQLSPEIREAQKLRQAGVWISCIGWAQMFVAGIIYVAASSVNHDASLNHIIGYDPYTLSPIYSSVFDPSLEDQRNRLQNASLSLFSIGGVMAAGGFVVYTIGQSRVSIWHKAHPKDPLPPLSGY
jgi:hypothetical protein